MPGITKHQTTRDCDGVSYDPYARAYYGSNNHRNAQAEAMNQHADHPKPMHVGKYYAAWTPTRQVVTTYETTYGWRIFGPGIPDEGIQFPPEYGELYVLSLLTQYRDCFKAGRKDKRGSRLCEQCGVED